MPPLLCVEVLWQQCSSNYNTLHQPSHSSLLTHHNLQPSHTETGSLCCFLWAEWVFGGKQRRFSCANVSQSAPSNHRPVFSRDQGLRHSLNNLAALCHRALGSQPSKVMTERRWLTSPSHSLPLPLIYRSWFQADKAEGRTGEEKSSALYKLCHKAEHNQTMTFSQRPQVGGDPLLRCAVK